MAPIVARLVRKISPKALAAFAFVTLAASMWHFAQFESRCELPDRDMGAGLSGLCAGLPVHTGKPDCLFVFAGQTRTTKVRAS